jgi:hypothetical protein
LNPPPRTHYRVLCVAPDATTEEIEQSFRQLARRLHPDLNGGDGAAEERMKELNVARAALTDPAARAAYDARLQRERRAEGAAAPPARTAAPPAPPPGGAPSAWGRSTPFPAAPPASARRPLVSWMRTRVSPPAPAVTAEIGRLSSVGRLAWIALVALIALAGVVGLILLREAVGS